MMPSSSPWAQYGYNGMMHPAAPASVSAVVKPPNEPANTVANGSPSIINSNQDAFRNNAVPSFSTSTLGLIPVSSSQSRDGSDSRDRSNDHPSSVSESSSSLYLNSRPATYQQQQQQPQQQRPYVSQFSATTSLILERMKGGSQDFNSALSDASAITTSRPDTLAFKEAKMRFMKHMMNGQRSPLPASEPSTSSQSQAVAQPEENGTKGTKRKRDLTDNDESDDPSSIRVDFTQNTIPFPPQKHTQRNSQPSNADVPVAAATLGVKGMCVKCGESSTEPSNLLAACGSCKTICHQACLVPMSAPPPATTEQSNSNANDDNDAKGEITNKEAASLCPRCGAVAIPGELPHDAYVSPELLRRKQKIERIRQMRLDALPEGVAPAKPELVGFGPGAASDIARTKYFANKTKTDALNLLSFCDQLRPQLLIDVLVYVSKKYPDLLMFDSPDWIAGVSGSAGRNASASSSKAAHPTKKANVAAGRPPHGRSLLNSKAKQKIKSGNMGKQPTRTGSSVSKRPPRRVQATEGAIADVIAAGVAEEDDEEEDAPPPTWPKAGEGLYVKLAPEINDRLFLADENDEEAFSHFMVDKMGRQIIDPV